jgi:hypothetical protein
MTTIPHPSLPGGASSRNCNSTAGNVNTRQSSKRKEIEDADADADGGDHSQNSTSSEREGQENLLVSGSGSDDSISASTTSQASGYIVDDHSCAKSIPLREKSKASGFLSAEEALVPKHPISDAFLEDTCGSQSSTYSTTPPRTEDTVEHDVGTSDAVEADEGIIYVTAVESDSEEAMGTVSRASSAPHPILNCPYPLLNLIAMTLNTFCPSGAVYTAGYMASHEVPLSPPPPPPREHPTTDTNITTKPSSPLTITLCHGPLHPFCGWGRLKLPPCSAMPMTFSANNELLFRISTGPLLVTVGDGVGKPTRVTVASGGMAQVRPGNWFALANASRTHFAVAMFWHAKRRTQRSRRDGGRQGGTSLGMSATAT